MFGYFGSKLRAERILAESSVPSTTLRCAQVHESLQMVLKPLTRLPLIPVPAGFCFQPIAADEVAQRIVELTFAAPAGLVSDIAGPRVQPMADLLREYLQTVGKRRLVVPLRVPGAAARAFRAGANLAPDHPTGRRTWQEFLAARCLSDADRQTRGARLREVTRHELA
jgi:uncharacterized protein YbjT (DUF2867 family)